MPLPLLLFTFFSGLLNTVSAQCPDYDDYSKVAHAPFSTGKYHLPYQRPVAACRKFNSSDVEATIEDMQGIVKDPDLFQLFQNAFPNTLDTTVTWRGYAANDSTEELTFVTTGDIVAMWLRDSANQMRSYKSLLKADDSPDSLASLFRGTINLQSRYIIHNPYCNAFQAPTESGLPPVDNGYADTDQVTPPYNTSFVFECKYELDSISAFLQLSHDYYDQTEDIDFFGKFQWVSAVQTILDVAEGLLVGTYADDGTVNVSPYTFQRTTTSATETLSNTGVGNPVKSGTGLVRSAFRPSDDATIYQLFIPANMQFSSYLGKCANIMKAHDVELAQRMSDFASNVRNGIETYGKVQHPVLGEIYAYEIDGFGSSNFMDDANVPSLLSAPILDYLDASDETYQSTRKFVLSTWNPYYMHGPVLNGTGGPHVGPGKAWPMSIITSLLTSDDDSEIVAGLQMLVSSTDGLGLIHESIDTFNASTWTREWFSWANGLFGEMLLGLKDRKPHLLETSFQ
ncbi:glycoside hydrolase family 125 protein [Annulohypoxylon truncatum]|uniref:glycoside hydrolase family 125 protein n=1 Tax=Annulohypoxylon truncatum TaxID=327061 RepID=UPI0020080315|nr:glycoside hydrolase family 125 protein [Annulohypoxylon truncatum]KAI1208262.1 glycoside hydrolase family 125 protein [Annulohypoxylon truncatum]